MTRIICLWLAPALGKMLVAFKQDYMSQKALLSPRGEHCNVPEGDSHESGGFRHVPPCIISGGFTQTPSLIRFCCLCLPFTWSGVTSTSTSACVASEGACKTQETPVLPLPLCWHNMQHPVIGTLIYQKILKGQKCWVILDTCNTPACPAASGQLNSSLAGRLSPQHRGLPDTLGMQRGTEIGWLLRLI